LYRVGTQIAMINAAANAGCNTILTGFGADEVLEAAPFYIADLTKRGRILAAWSESARWARHYNRSPWRFFWPFGLEPLMPVGLHGGLKALLRRGYSRWGEQN